MFGTHILVLKGLKLFGWKLHKPISPVPSPSHMTLSFQCRSAINDIQELVLSYFNSCVTFLLNMLYTDCIMWTAFEFILLNCWSNICEVNVQGKISSPSAKHEHIKPSNNYFRYWSLTHRAERKVPAMPFRSDFLQYFHHISWTKSN